MPQIADMPKYRAHLSRHGHNLNHKFDFTSSTGHLLTIFGQVMNPKEKITGHIDLFSRTQPLNSPSHVEINTYIDYFFVPLDMLYSGFGDSLYQTNEPYSAMIKVSNNNLPVFIADGVPDMLLTEVLHTTSSSSKKWVNFNKLDDYAADSLFFSIYRNMFHNAMNPNSLFLSSQLTGLAVPTDQYQPNVLPLLNMAYNCVYQNFYRLDEREKFDNSLYNIDGYLYDDDAPFQGNELKFLQLKYRPLAFDYFTSAKVQPLINPLNINGNTSNSSLLAVNNYLNSIGVGVSGTAGNNTNATLAGVVANVYSRSDGFIPVNSTGALRSVFAVEKILSVTGRAKKTYDAQVLAHLGVDVPRDIKHEITYVGTQKGVIKVGEIIATAGTEDTPLGDLAGKGYGNVGIKNIDFTAPCHGIFIGIYSAVPRISYYSPLEKQFQISSRLDFFHPEFEKLGMQPIFGYECTPYNTSVASAILGWQMRYQQYKQRFDKVSPAFIDHYTSQTSISDEPKPVFNQWKNWVLSSRPFRTFATSNNPSYITRLHNFLSLPTDLNNIMTVKYGWTDSSVPSSGDIPAPQVAPDYWNFDAADSALSARKGFASNVATLFYRDPLIHFGEIKFKLVSEMSDNTLPDLNF